MKAPNNDDLCVKIPCKQQPEDTAQRRNLCVLFAQVADTDEARKFWYGKLTNTKRATVMTMLLNSFDNNYRIYEDVEGMAMSLSKYSITFLQLVVMHTTWCGVRAHQGIRERYGTVAREAGEQAGCAGRSGGRAARAAERARRMYSIQ